MAIPELHDQPEQQQLPFLDITQPLLASTTSSLSQACKDWGFFHITNHGIPMDLFKSLQLVSDQVFTLPLDSKLRAGPSTPTNTYTPHFIASPFYESLRVSGPDYYASARGSADVLFDKPNEDFCNVFQECGGKMMELSRKITQVLLKCLGDDIEAKYHRSDFSNCHGYFRVNSYTPPDEIIDERFVEGLGMHTDMSCITILYQDETGGLQMRSREGGWIDVGPREGTLVVNVGDLLQAWSNGRLRSAEHQVVLRRNAGRRFSLAFFWCFEDEMMVSAPEELVGEGEQRAYEPFLCSEYMKFRHSSERGRFDKVGFTVRDFAAAAPSKKLQDLVMATDEFNHIKSAEGAIA